MNYWNCERCGQKVFFEGKHCCPNPPTYWHAPEVPILPVLERIEQSLLRIEKLLEKEL